MNFRATASLLALLLISTASAQWRELPLPSGTVALKAAGNPVVPGALALWIQKTPIADSSFSILFIPTQFYLSSNGGTTWDFVDSTVFRYIDQPPVVYADDPYDLQYVGDEIARTIHVLVGVDQDSSFFQYRKGSDPFLPRRFAHPVNQAEGTPWLFLTDGALMFNVYLRLFESDDSTTFALLQSSNGGADWSVVPDSTGVIRMARATCIGYRLKFPVDMYMGTVRGLYRSPNGGLSWDFFPTYTDIDSMTVRSVVVHPDNPSLMYVVGYNPTAADMRDKVFRSLDRGFHWDLVFTDTLVTGVAVSIADDRYALMNAAAGLQFTTDRGSTWYRVQRNLPPQGDPYRVQWIHLDAGNPRRATVSIVNKLYVNDDLTGAGALFAAPGGTEIVSCYPSPWSPRSGQGLWIEYTSPHAGAAVLFRLHDVLGRLVWRNEIPDSPAGRNLVTIDRQSLARLSAGVYLLTMVADGAERSRSLVISR